MWPRQKLRRQKSSRLTMPQSLVLHGVARTLRSIRRGLPVNDLRTEAAAAGVALVDQTSPAFYDSTPRSTAT